MLFIKVLITAFALVVVILMLSLSGVISDPTVHMLLSILCNILAIVVIPVALTYFWIFM